MTNSTKKATAALAAAVVLASAGYTFGSQAGDGSATAAGSSSTSSSERRDRGDRGLSSLADRLGVSESKLATALAAVRADIEKTERTDHAAALAKALGIEPSKVEAAFTKLHEERRTAFAAAIAKSLGVSADKVEAALEKVRSADPGKDGGPGRHRHGADVAALAEELNVTQAKLGRALRAARPAKADRADRSTELAKALGVTEEKLEAAFDQLRDDEEAEHEARHAAFAAALAKELGISADKVEAALPEGGPRGAAPGHGGPRGFAGPGGPR